MNQFPVLLLLLIAFVLASFSDGVQAQDVKKSQPLKGNPFAQEAPPGEMATDGKSSWPELVGMDGEEAKLQLEREMPGKDVFLVPAGSMVTMDYREDRVRIWLDEEGKVARAPRLG